MSLKEFHNPNGGTRWRLTTEGIEVEGRGIIRTKGKPLSMIQLWEDYGDDILHSSYELEVPVDVIAAMIPIEAVRKDGSLSFDPKSDRLEPGYESDEETPHRRSPGLMQTLISTAQSMDDKYDLLDGEKVTAEILFDPFYSIMLGTAYLAHQIERYGMDPVLMCGAYNAGSVRSTSKNDWKIMTYGETRMDRYIEWFNDFHAAIRQGEIEIPEGTLLSLPSEED